MRVLAKDAISSVCLLKAPSSPYRRVWHTLAGIWALVTVIVLVVFSFWRIDPAFFDPFNPINSVEASENAESIALESSLDKELRASGGDQSDALNIKHQNPVGTSSSAEEASADQAIANPAAVGEESAERGVDSAGSTIGDQVVETTDTSEQSSPGAFIDLSSKVYLKVSDAEAKKLTPESVTSRPAHRTADLQ